MEIKEQYDEINGYHNLSHTYIHILNRGRILGRGE